jgi:hypothetical protein
MRRKTDSIRWLISVCGWLFLKRCTLLCDGGLGEMEGLDQAD